MCGIFGWALPRASAPAPTALVSATNKLAHRGPDSAGYWTGGEDSAWQIAFGHRRLAIIDLSPGGAQPMEFGDYVVTFNGEIYNFVELRKELEALGHVFRSASDTEVLLQAYARWGAASVARFRGLFAFALWNKKERTLFLARDQFGKKPLFYTELNGGLVFSSEIGPLAGFDSVDRRVDWSSIDEYLLRRYVPGPHTFYRAIKKLPPGSYAIWRDGKLQQTRYYTPPYAGDGAVFRGTFDDAVEQFRTMLDDAVRIRLRCDAPFGAFLSGGLDSSAVVALMAAHVPQVKTFSIGFREQDFSEFAFARTIADRFSTDHREIIIEPAAVPDNILKAIAHRGAPLSEPADIPMMILSQAASQSVKMVLTGEGADELLGGYPKHKAERWMRRYQSAVPAALHARLFLPLIESLPDFGRRLQIAARAADAGSDTDRMTAWFAPMHRGLRDALTQKRFTHRALDAFPFSSRSESPLRRLLFFDQTSWLPDNLLERADRMMMAAAVEGRMPFMDTHLAAKLAEFPDRFIEAGAGGKRVLRCAMQGVLPPEIISRRKNGFRVPIGEWFRTTLRDYVGDLLEGPHSRIATILDQPTIHRIFDEHQSRRKNHESAIWTLLNLEQFLRSAQIELS